MAVGSLQESGIAMARQLGHRLLVHTVVEHCGHEVVAQRVQMELTGKPFSS